ATTAISKLHIFGSVRSVKETVKNPLHFEFPHRFAHKLLKSSCDALQRSVARWRILRFPLSESTLIFRIFSLQPTGLFVK
ncbi:hypothetical protein, partial [Enterobacter hormaechei]|uniref:hypothetical protein n=1 Tax=Enterobacter hormaechei TaxID=158836 RepID=UPI001A9DDCC0